MKKALHFFPGEHQIIWEVDGKPEIKAEGWGGEAPVPGEIYKTMKPRRTTAGRYVIHSYGPYKTNRWRLSKIAWGTKLLYDPARRAVMYATGHIKPAWKKVQDLIPDATVADLRDSYYHLYGHTGKYDANGDGLPDIWIYNDFGSWAVRYFKDENHDGKLDADEHLSGEMFHSTQINEAESERTGKVNLTSSHGCIHLSPDQREQLLKAGAFAKGTNLIIHKYSAKVPLHLQ